MALPKQRTVETMSVSEARRHFSDALNRVRRDDVRIIVEKSGIPVGAFVSVEDIQRLERLEKERAERMRDLREALAMTRAELQGIPPEEIEREIAKAMDEVDEEERRLARPAERK